MAMIASCAATTARTTLSMSGMGAPAWGGGLGGGVIVCPGVTIGDNCVIGAGSVVTKDIPARSLAVGNPARVLRQLDDSTFGPRHQHLPQETPQ